MQAGSKTGRQSNWQAGRQAGMCVCLRMCRQLIPFICQLVGGLLKVLCMEYSRK